MAARVCQKYYPDAAELEGFFAGFVPEPLERKRRIGPGLH
jgi:hypothetical protein